MVRIFPSTVGGVLAAVGSAVAQEADSDTLSRFEFSRLLMGVEARLVLYAEDAGWAEAAAVAAYGRIAELDAVLSDYRPDSEIMRLCDGAGGPAVGVSEDLMGCIQASLGHWERTEGAFDPTAGPVVKLWREARRTGQVPDLSLIEGARRLIDARAIVVDVAAGTVRIDSPGVRLDMGGIGKGFAAQEAARVLADGGHARCLVALAGDIFVGEPPPGRDGWTVEVWTGLVADEPRLLLSNCAVSTSGEAEQYLEIDGVRYSHIVDPRTGWAVTRRTAATVVAPDGTTADALPTALCVLGIAEGPRIADRLPGVGVRMVERQGESAVTGVNAAFCRVIAPPR